MSADGLAEVIWGPLERLPGLVDNVPIGSDDASAAMRIWASDVAGDG